MAVRTLFNNFRAVVHYNQLPQDYEDGVGIPFRKEELSQKEVNTIFGPRILAQDANRLLRIIHGRRVAGTLDDPDLQQNTSEFATAHKVKALEYLRKHIPVDEIINAGLRAEDELKLLEEQEQQQQEQDKQADQQLEESTAQTKSHQDPAEQENAAPTGRLPGKEPQGDSIYGEGAFDKLRKQNIAKREAEEKRLEEERLKKEEEEALGNIGTLQTETAKPRAMSPWAQKHADRASSDLEAPPEMKAWERLLPSTTFALLIVGVAAVLAAFYTPPRNNRRLWPEVPPAAATCMALILGNLFIFGLWRFPPAWALLNRYMLLVAATPRPFQLLGSIFSHQSPGHFAGNMIALWFFGIRLHDEVGRGNFLALYFASGALGFLGSLFNLVLFRGLQYTTLGASGAVYGVITAFFWMHKSDEFKIFGYPPDPLSGPTGAVFLGLIAGFHLWAGLLSRSAAFVSADIASHVGGMIVGALGVELIQRHMDAKFTSQTEEATAMGGVLGKATETKPKADENEEEGAQEKGREQDKVAQPSKS
jgi:rhomboid-like protein